jgi:hypothetical protein
MVMTIEISPARLGRFRIADLNRFCQRSCWAAAKRLD